MEKIINIGGVDVRLKSTAATPLIYKNQFKTSFLTDLMLLSKAFQNGTDISKMSYNQIRNVDLDIFYNFVWVLAKGADKNIEPPLEWFAKFGEFDLEEVTTDVMELLVSSIGATKKKLMMSAEAMNH